MNWQFSGECIDVHRFLAHVSLHSPDFGRFVERSECGVVGVVKSPLGVP